MPMLHTLPAPKSSRMFVLSLQSFRRPLPLRFPPEVRRHSVFKDWKGTSSEDHVVERSKKGDTEDIHADMSASGVEERKAHERGAEADSKSQGMTEKGGAKHGKKAKEDHPSAPEPVIGMNDERAKKGE